MYVINGANIKSTNGFYDIVEELFTNNLSWKFGRNMDAFADVLIGGFGKHEYGEEILIEWLNFKKSKEYLDSEFIEKILEIIEEANNVKFVKYDSSSQ